MNAQSRTTAYIASWILPVSAPPVREGALIVGAGRVVSIVDARELHEGAIQVDEIVDLGSTVLMPGLVNVHSHLELTALRGVLEGLTFPRWLQVLTSARNELFDEADNYTASTAGIREGLLAGVTTFADASATGAPMRALVDSGARGIVYQEVFGPDPAHCAESMQSLEAAVEQLQRHATSRVAVGVSPHAPYTVSSRLFAAVARLATDRRLPLSVHVAESSAEVELVRHARGAFADRLNQRGILVSETHRSPIALLEETGVLATKPLLVHAIHVDDEDLASIAAAGASIAHCPASNARLGQGIAPLNAMLDAGITVGLGSDSVASNNMMDILGEARQATLFAGALQMKNDAVTARDALQLATIGGARALGLDAVIGTLEPGKAADVVAFPVDESRVGPIHDPVVALIHTMAGKVSAKLVLVDGEPLVVDGRLVNQHDGIEARMNVIARRLGAWIRRPG